MRERCYQCFRPLPRCFCEAIPRIDNRTNVLILQHVGERFHPFNTARIVRQALRHCSLIADHNQRFGQQHLPIEPNAGLLYPQADAPELSQLPAEARPAQLVIVDGTWHQAKTIVRDAPQLRELPCFRLKPTSPGQYRIRREPDAQSLSTLEATVAALRALEPETVGLDQLLSAFHKMVESQLGHPATHAVWRQNKSKQSRPRHLPHSLLKNAESLVVAYGEATPGQPGQRLGTPTPVNWVAQRLGTQERFCCQLRQPQPLSDTSLQHMQLTDADFDDALSADDFRQRWNCFLRRHDVLIVYHRRTHQLLGNIGASQPRCLVLKSIFGNWRSGIQSLEELLTVEGLGLPTSDGHSRASRRLDMAVAIVEHLRKHYGKLPQTEE